MEHQGNVTFVGDYAVITTQVLLDVAHEHDSTPCAYLCECCLQGCDCGHDEAIEQAEQSLKEYHGIDVKAAGLGVDSVTLEDVM